MLTNKQDDMNSREMDESRRVFRPRAEHTNYRREGDYERRTYGNRDGGNGYHGGRRNGDGYEGRRNEGGRNEGGYDNRRYDSRDTGHRGNGNGQWERGGRNGDPFRRDTPQDLPGLKVSRDKLLLEIKEVEKNVLSIREQLERARHSSDPERTEGSSWWHRASDALGYKERDLRNLHTRAEKIQRRIDRLDHPAINHFEREQREQKKVNLKTILHALLDTARKAREYAEDEESTEATEEALFASFDRLDEVLPGWDNADGKGDQEGGKAGLSVEEISA